MAKIFKDKYVKSYTVIDNSIIDNTTLSFKAKGIFLHLWKQDDNWDFYVTELAKRSSDGVASIKSGLKELENEGYLKRVPSHSDDGKFAGMDWLISDKPRFNNVSTVKPISRPTVLSVDGVSRPTEIQSLRSTNNKKYQSIKEVTTKEYIGQAEPTNAPKVPYKEIVDYLNQKVGTSFKSAARANQSIIKARFKEGYTLDDFKKVIDNKADTWLNDNEMSKYLRPATLFGNKFDSYLNERHKPLTAKEKDWGY